MKLRRKGFTIVELVIVIAVIAILAAVLIPTFVNLTKKANMSADQVAVRNMNTALSVAKVTDGTINSPSEARTALSEAGFNGDNLIPTTKDHKFYWNSTYNVVLLVDCSNEDDSKWVVVYPGKGYEEAINEFNDETTRYEKNFPLSNIPNAKVNPDSISLTADDIFSNGKEWNEVQFINLGADENLSLDVALTFIANETGEQAVEAGYGDWIVDFIIIASEDLDQYATNGTEFYLAGQYDNPWTKDEWVVINATNFGVTAGTENYLLRDFGFVFNYESICDDVKNFNCGVAAVGKVPTGLTITVQLVMFESQEHYNNGIIDHIIYEYNHVYK